LTERFRAFAKLSFAFARCKFWFILCSMQSQNAGRNEARTLRDHLSHLVSAKQHELEQKLGKSSVNSRDELMAEVSQEAADLDYERWDGLS
jgi:hypothetical protein